MSFYSNTLIHQPNGAELDLTRPAPEAISFSYIATCLGNLNRYGGGTAFPYSVAQHSLNMARCAARWYPNDLWMTHSLQMACLLHDAHEAYTGDITRPVQNTIRKYSAALIGAFLNIQSDVQEAIDQAACFESCEEWDEIVNDLDRRICLDEVAVLHPGREDIITELEPLGLKIERWREGEAERHWLNAFNFLQMALS